MGVKERMRRERRGHESNPQPRARRVPAILIVAALSGAALLGYFEYRANQPQLMPANSLRGQPLPFNSGRATNPPPFPGRGRGGRRGDPPIPGMTLGDDMSVVTSRYGKPDADTSSEGMNPPPPIVTRRITYQKQRLMVVYRQDGTSWRLVGFVDTDTNSAIPPKVAYQRMNPPK